MKISSNLKDFTVRNKNKIENQRCGWKEQDIGIQTSTLIQMQENTTEPSKDRWEHCPQSHQCVPPQGSLSCTWMPHLRSPSMLDPHQVTDKSRCGNGSLHSWVHSWASRGCGQVVSQLRAHLFLVQIYSLPSFPHVWIQEAVLIDVQHSNSVSEPELWQQGAWCWPFETPAPNDG